MKTITPITQATLESVFRMNVRKEIRKTYRYDVTVYFANDSQLFVEFLGVTGSTLYKAQFDDIYTQIMSGLTSADVAKIAQKNLKRYLVNKFFYPAPIDNQGEK